VEELQLALTTARVEQRNFGLWINNWQVGQVLNALVSSQLPSGELVLRVGGQQVTATADIPIQQGTQLMLEVKQLRPVPTLRLLSPLPSATTAEVGGTLRLLGPAGADIASRPLASVATALQASPALQGAAVASALPPPLLESLSRLLRQFGSPERLLQPEGLAAAIRDSGLFLERRLATAAERGAGRGTGSAAVAARDTTQPLSTDLKANLLRALVQVDAALARAQAVSLPAASVETLLELRRELEAGVGRLTLQQLSSTPAEGAQAGRSWQFELPQMLGSAYHTLILTIEAEPGEQAGDGDRDDGAQEQGDTRWHARLRMDLPALGELDLRLALSGTRVDVQLQAERESTRQALEAQLPLLERALASRGLELGAHRTALLPGREAAGDATDAARSRLDVSV
jgi:hypothetical protein